MNVVCLRKTNTLISNDCRHAESAWNLVFNKGFGSDFPGRLRDAVVKEAKLGNTLDSVFMDSPLSKIGTDQAEALQEFVETGEEKLSELLRGKEGDSIMCSSNLRRALSTLTIGMWERLKRTQEKIYVLSSLQEITFNVDGVSLAKPGLAPQLSDTELNSLYGGGDASKFDPDRYYDCAFNAGNKPVFTTGIERMQQFCAWCFEQEASTIIAGGHSLYNRFFFKTFLPKSSSHESKVKKMQNCAVVSMTLKKGKKKNKTWYAIDEDSVDVVYLGFEEKKKKKKKTA